ncbi:MAG: FtsX-like permease family protein [Acidobacteriota bacterium]
MGGALGAALAWQGVRLIRQSIPDFFARVVPSLLDFSIDGEALLFTLALSLLTGMAFGLAPALRASRTDIQDSLKDGDRQTGASGRLRLRRTLAVAQVALSTVLLVGSGLMIRTFWNLQSQDPGFAPEKVLAFDVSLSQSKYPDLEQRRAFYGEAERRIAGLPGVEAVGAVNRLPFSTSNSGTGFAVEGRPQAAPGEVPFCDFRLATPGYFEAMGIPLERGRGFTPQDGPDAPSAVIVNQALVRLHFPSQDPLGKRIRLGRLGQNAPWSVIVGVAGDVRHNDMRDRPRPEAYLPYAQYPALQMTLAISSAHPPKELAAAVRAEMRAFAPEQPVFNLQPLQAMLSRSLFALSFPMRLTAIFAGVALTLAAVGLYGVISFLVGQRPREYGLRMALGARRSDILRMVMGQGLGLVLGGLALGLAGALAAARLLESLLFGVTPADPLTFAAVAALLAAVALAACFIPARRATCVDPQSALRCE